MNTSKTVLAALALATALGLTACGGDADAESSKPKAPDVTAWKADLADLGIEPRDWDGYVASAKSICEMEDYGLFVTLDSDVPNAATRVGIEHQCPERLDDWDKAIVNLDDLTARVDYICNTPREELTAEDQEEADAVCM